ncbi:MAG: ABC transporter ATP-binding protein [Chloroflexota bacterium]|nr:ABC transporter ATP-binding protein [Chloroflexota bacterium]
MPEAVIKTSVLTRRYGKLTAVDKLNLNVPKGSVYGFLGPNGAGKTTTIRMLLGLIRPNEGQVRLFGMPLEQHRIVLLQRVGALVETPSLYPHLTGYENLEVTRRLIGAQREQIAHALAIVKLEQDAYRRVREYSHGMCQRLGLALALLSKPELLVLDEPTNGLDPAGMREMRELIRRFPTEYGVTIFLSSHLLSEVEQVATHVGIIHKGHLLFQGTLGELQAQQQGYVRLSVSQPDKAIKILTRAGWTVQRDGEYLIVRVDGRTATADINNLLVQQEVKVFGFDIEHPSLEDIFLQLTEAETEERSST